MQCQYLDTFLEKGEAFPSTSRFRERELVISEKKAIKSAKIEDWFNKQPIRTHAQIKAKGEYEITQFRTKPMKNMQIEKLKYLEKLVGVEKDSRNVKKFVEEELDEHEMSIYFSKLVMGEINERRIWLEDMSAMGREGQFKEYLLMNNI
jgi:hypothetical protein